jgi:hypothetical protein
VKKLFLFLLFFFCLVRAHAQSCSGASCSSTDCTYANVLAALPTSGNTNPIVTVAIPACSATTWTSNLSYAIPSSVSELIIEGSGTPNVSPSTFGAGTITSTIVHNAGNSNPLMKFTATYGQTLVLENLNILPITSSTVLSAPIWLIGTCTSSGCPQARIDNIQFGSGSQIWGAGNGSNSGSMLVGTNFYGVIDHSTLPNGSVAHLFTMYHSSWLGVGSYGDNSWASPDSLGGASNFFAENNVFYSTIVPLNDSEQNIGSTTLQGGGRNVVRFNEVFTSSSANFMCGGHGTDSNGRPRGIREVECYGNTWTNTNASCCDISVSSIRSGVLYDFNNTAVVSTNLSAWLNLSEFRRFASYSPWGFGAGSGSWDDNDGTTYASGTATGGNGSTTLTVSGTPWSTNQWQDSGDPYSVTDTTTGCSSEIVSNTSNALTFIVINNNSGACSSGMSVSNGDSYQILRASILIDQPTRGDGNYISGSTPSPTGWVSEALDPTYQWDDTVSGGTVSAQITTGSTGELSLIANRDWYSQASGVQTSNSSPFNGTSGTGWGPCGAACGGGGSAFRPSTCTTGVGYWATDVGNWNQSGSGGQGELFICTATNTWTLSYAPYTYPHPLDNSGNPPVAPPGGQSLIAKLEHR